MSMLTNTNEIDDWSVYRRLVVDTLKRLDERTAELHERLTHEGNKILLIDNRLKDLDLCEQEITGLRAEITNIKSERSTEKVVRRIAMAVGAGVWTVFTIGLSAWVANVLG